jgi:hypothetical protein
VAKVKIKGTDSRGRKLEPTHICYTYCEAFKRHSADNIALVKQFGVDWDKTQMPKVSHEQGFEGTFAESSKHEALLGTLVLADGNELMIGVPSSEKNWGSYVQAFIDMHTNRSRIGRVFGD